MKKIMYGVVSFGLIYPLAAFCVSQEETLCRINDIHLETQHLHAEIERLRSELSHLRAKRTKSAPCWRQFFPKCSNFWNASYPPINMNNKDCEAIGEGTTQTGFSKNSRQEEINRLMANPLNVTLLAALGSTVTTSPFLGLRSAFDASDLIITLPTMNEDLRFLKEEVQLRKKLRCYGITLPDRPIIVLGGKIEGLAFIQEDFADGPTRSDINIGSVRLEVLVRVSRAVHAFIAFNMDSSAFNLLNFSNPDVNVQLAGAGSRIFNSRVVVSRAFTTIGDLDCLPFYFTIGQMFVPFGRYATNMVTNPLTIDMARTNERAILFGYYKKGLYGSVYAFSGATEFGGSGIDTYGINFGYEKTYSKGSYNIGAGYIANIADATGFQLTSNSVGFFGFGLNSKTEILEHRVAAIDVHGEFAYGRFNVFGEYITTVRAFDVCNLNFNGHGAEPSVSNVELAYNFQVMTCPASLAVGYDTTREALALGLPRSSFLTVFNISIWKNTIESLEFRRDTNYNRCDFAGGNGAVPPIVFSGGGTRNVYTLQVGVYF
jgi:hypothetical protein